MSQASLGGGISGLWLKPQYGGNGGRNLFLGSDRNLGSFRANTFGEISFFRSNPEPSRCPGTCGSCRFSFFASSMEWQSSQG